VNLWKAIKRLNSRTDDWSRRAFDRMITNIDSPSGRSVGKHISVRDLIRSGLRSGDKSP
jgi:hypothetical protein